MQTSCGATSIELDPKRAPRPSTPSCSSPRRGTSTGSTSIVSTPSIDVIQGGDPSGDGTGGPGYAIPDELTGDESYTPGTLAMANAGANSGGSQFFLITGPAGTNLDGNPAFTIFGKVVEGLDVAHRIQKLPDRGPRFRRHLRAAARGGRLHRVGDDREVRRRLRGRQAVVPSATRRSREDLRLDIVVREGCAHAGAGDLGEVDVVETPGVPCAPIDVGEPRTEHRWVVGIQGDGDSGVAERRERMLREGAVDAGRDVGDRRDLEGMPVAARCSTSAGSSLARTPCPIRSGR